jgi:hypothetical protein
MEHAGRSFIVLVDTSEELTVPIQETIPVGSHALLAVSSQQSKIKDARCYLTPTNDPKPRAVMSKE